jgi:hypothetical protein
VNKTPNPTTLSKEEAVAWLRARGCPVRLKTLRDMVERGELPTVGVCTVQRRRIPVEALERLVSPQPQAA